MNNCIKENYFNTITSLLPIMISCNDKEDDKLIKYFSTIASLNHISHKRNNNIVKPFFSKLILKNNVPDVITNIITTFDTLPLLSDKFVDFEKFGAFVRQFIIFKNEFKLLSSDKYTFITCFICKCIYLYERQERIKNNKREKFGMLHIAEHIEVLLYLMNNIQNNKKKTKNNIIIYLIVTGVIIPCIIFKIYNAIIINTYIQNLPQWFDKTNISIMEKKIENNYNSSVLRNPYKYFTKIVSPVLSWDIQTWSIIEKQLENISTKIKNSKFKPDICIGIKTGGMLCLKYLTELLHCNQVHYLKCKTWSGNTFTEDWIHVINMIRDYDNYLKNADSCKIEELTDFPKNINNKKSYKILLFDDTISTGKTICATRDYIQKKYPKSTIKICALIIPHDINKKIEVDYYDTIGNVPIFWPWGCELD